MTIYQRTMGSTTYYSNQASEPDEETYNGLLKSQRLLPPEVFEAAKAKLAAEAETGEPQPVAVDTLAVVTETYDRLYPMARETMGARTDLTLALLKQEPALLTKDDEALPEKKRYLSAADKHVNVVKQASGWGWQKLQQMCVENGEIVVPIATKRAIDEKVDEGKAGAAARVAAAEAKKQAAS